MRLALIGFLVIAIERFVEMVLYGKALSKKLKNSLANQIHISNTKKDFCLIVMVTSVFVLIFISIGTPIIFLKNTYSIACGYLIFFVGAFIRIAAMRELGAQWSTNIHRQIYDSQKRSIVQSGIYSKMRHPVFYGAIIESLAIPLMFSSGIAYFYVFIFHIPWVIYRSLLDEKECLSFYKENYLEYIRKVPFFVGLPEVIVKWINYYSVKHFWLRFRSKREIDFAWIVHPFSDQDMFKVLPYAKFIYSLSVPLYRNLQRVMAKIRVFKFTAFGPLLSPAGSETSGLGVATCILTKDIIRAKNQDISKKIKQAIKKAEREGAKIVSLAGAFSMFGNEGRDFVSKDGVKITNGKHLIAWVTLAQIDKVLDYLKIDSKNLTAAIVGADLGLGRLIAESMFLKFSKVNLCKYIDARFSQRSDIDQSKINICKSIDEAVSSADVVVFAVAGAGLMFNTALLKPSSIFCDTTMPFVMARKIYEDRKDVFSIETSWIRLPSSYNVDFLNKKNDYYSIGMAYGCLGEVILLSLEKYWDDFSLDDSTFSLKKINQIENMVKKHGFQLPEYRCHDKLYTASDINGIFRK